MQLVVVMAVRKAVSAATITFTAISISRFFSITSNIFHHSFYHPLLPSYFSHLKVGVWHAMGGAGGRLSVRVSASVVVTAAVVTAARCDGARTAAAVL